MQADLMLGLTPIRFRRDLTSKGVEKGGSFRVWEIPTARRTPSGLADRMAVTVWSWLSARDPTESGGGLAHAGLPWPLPNASGVERLQA